MTTFVNATGATHVRIVFTVYQASINSTTIYAKPPPSPLQTAPNSTITAAIAHAKSIGLSVALAMVLDPDWDLPNNPRSPGGPWRGQIGEGFGDAQWEEWFASYSSFLLGYAELAAGVGGVDLFEIGSELEIAFQQASQWREVVSKVKKVLPDVELTIAGNQDPSPVTWWDALDYVGIDAYVPLTGASNGSADALVAYWLNDVIPAMEAVATKFNKPILITEVGYQSRPNCHLHPPSTPRPDQPDCSGYLECYDPEAQAQAYEGLLRAWATRPMFRGVYWWLVRGDVTAGGVSDSDFTPLGKPAGDVLSRWYGNEGFVAADDFAGSGAIVDAINSINANTPAASGDGKGIGVGRLNGFVFGGDSEWSAPHYRYGSIGARTSLASMRSIGANTVQIVNMRYYRTNNDTTFYSKSDGSTLRTPSNSEIIAMLQDAKSLNFTTLLSPMLDPDYDLPGNCRQCASPPGPGWRGTIGQSFGSNCSMGTPWYAWWKTYRQYILSNAVVAATAPVDIFLVAHELQTPTQHCPDLWKTLIRDVRSILPPTVQVSAAFNAPIITYYPNVPWIADLDFIGVDAYYGLDIPVPSLPWKDANASTVKHAWDSGPTASLANLSMATGKDILITETGAQSRPWSYSRGSTVPPGHQLDPTDCSVWDQCMSSVAQSLYYDGMMQSLYSHNWFKGFTLWLWRADPSAGGGSDDSFTPSGKPESIATLKKFWQK